MRAKSQSEKSLSEQSQSEKPQSEKYREEAERARLFAEHARTPQEREALREIEREFERLAVLRDDMSRKRLSRRLT